MPHYPVLQPDGKLAVWSTIVDTFTAFDCTQADAVSILQQWHTGNLSEATAKVANGEIPFEHWDDWAGCVAWAQFMHGADDATVKAALERTPDTMTCRYIEQFVATCQSEAIANDLRHERDQLRAELAAATQRAEAAGREHAELYVKYRIAIQQLAAANNEHGFMYGDETDAIKRAEEAESALMVAMAESHDYRLMLQDVVSGTAIGQLETDLAYYKAMVAAVPKYIESCQEDYAAGIDTPITLEQWFEDVSSQDDDR